MSSSPPPAPADAPSVPTREQRLVLVIAVLASFVTFLDGSVINVALPAISDELGGGITVQQWVVDAYLITLGTLILLAGSLSDAFGRERILRVGLVGFAATSVAIALAPTAEFIVIARGLQGVAGALLVPSSLALIIASFRGPQQGRAIGQWTGWTSAAFLVGPLLGGLFVDFLSWRLVFAINVIPIALTLILLSRLGSRAVERSSVRIDWWGAVLGIIGLGGPVFALIEHERFGWASPAILVPLVGGVAAFVWFIARQRSVANPMIPLSLFAVRNFSVGNVSTALVYAALSLGGLVVSVYLQQVGGYSATASGLAFLPVTLASIALSSVFGGLAARWGARWFMGVGPIVAGAGYLLLLPMGESPSYWTEVFPGIAVFALGLSITVAPLTAAILGSIPESQSGIGSAFNNAVSRIAGLIAIAALGIILGGELSPESLDRALWVTAALLIVGGLVSIAGIRSARPEGKSSLTS